MNHRKPRWVYIAALSGAYGVSFLLPADLAFRMGGSIYALVLSDIVDHVQGNGAFDFQFLCNVIGWSPNVFFLLGVGLLAVRCDRLAFGVGLAASICACIWRAFLPYLNLGYYLWLACMVLLAVIGRRLALIRDEDARSVVSRPFSPSIMDPEVATLFNRPKERPAGSTDVHSGSPPGEPPSLLQPPSSPSS